MKRRVIANYDATKEPIVGKIENAAKQILRNRCESRYDLDADEIACDIAYMSRIQCHPYVSGGASFTAFPGGRYKQVTLHGFIPKPNKVFSNPQKWAQFIIDALDRQVGGDVVEFWYKKMKSQDDIHNEIQRMQIESSTRGNSQMKKFTKYPSNYVRASADDVYVWDGQSSVPKDVVYVQIASDVTQIGREVFSKCSNLAKIDIPDKVTVIGYGAFEDCTSLTHVKLPSSLADVGTGAFIGCTSLEEVTIPSSLTYIANWMFADCTKLTRIHLPNSIGIIGVGAFAGCTSLPEVSIPSSVYSIGHRAFDGCENLTQVNIPSGLENIEDDAFSGCPIQHADSSSRGTIDEWYYSDEGEEDRFSFAEKLENMLKNAYPNIVDYFEEPSIQGLEGGNFITFYLDEEYYSYHFDWFDQLSEIYENGPESAAKVYFDKIKQGIDDRTAVS